MKPPVPYFGGKQRIAEQIVDLFPEHLHYVEPFAGGLSVLLAKPPSRMETINDLDGDLVTFWRVLRDRPDELAAAAALTPHSRAELAIAKDRDDIDDLERARRVWVQLTQGRTGTLLSTGWRYHGDPAGTSMSLPAYLRGYIGRMPAAAARLAATSIECRPALDVINDYGQHTGNLIYVDPPYLGDTRTGRGYRHEMPAEDDHRALAEALNSCRASVVLSGYRSDLYDGLFGEWNVHTIAASSGQGSVWKEKTEVCWLNYEPHPHLFSAVPS